jgi:S-ribosylhomocysteine lyase LuxS involved in autoinducer biosynthesis
VSRLWRAVEIAGVTKRVLGPMGRQTGSHLTLSGGCEFRGNRKKKVAPWFGSLT